MDAFMVETVFVIRHGATEGSEVPRYKGATDVPISEKGEAQVRSTAEFMEKNGLVPDAVYSSTLSRALRSAEIVASRFGLEQVGVPELRERDFGLWEGMSFEEIQEKFPDAFSSWARDPLRYSPLEGESTLDVRDRVMPALEQILHSHKGGTVAVVAHGGVNRVVLAEFMGLPLEHIFRIEQDNACLNIVRFHDGLPVVELLNGRYWKK
jgi:alpha-ribazole phosphatase/probable phosphoglycerate mutase